MAQGGEEGEGGVEGKKGEEVTPDAYWSKEGSSFLEHTPNRWGALLGGKRRGELHGRGGFICL